MTNTYFGLTHKAYAEGYHKYKKDNRERSKYDNPYNTRVDAACFFAWNDGWFDAKSEAEKQKKRDENA